MKSPMNNPINRSDTRQRFLFDHSDVRGEITSLRSSFQQITCHQNYPQAVTALFGEFLAAASLLSATLKFPGIYRGHQLENELGCSWQVLDWY